MASALDNLTSTTTTKATTMPAWYDAAQQSAVGKAMSAVNTMPSIGNTVAGQAISSLSNPNTNPFNQAQGTLNTIGQGAANPWLTGANGEVTPNTNTALGGLFSAQDKQLHTLLPQYEAPATAGAIGSGNFGSLRGDTAADTAITNAQAQLTAQQMQAALQNQQTGVNAATGLGNVGNQAVTTETNLGKIQQADPMAQSGALAALMSNIKAPTTETQTANQSTIGNLGTLGTLWSGNGTAANPGIKGGVTGILDSIFGNSSSGSTPSGGDYWLNNPYTSS